MMLERFNFCRKWRSWIKECGSTASASILVNKSPTKKFRLEQGSRQRDPLSPFLYLLVAEDLSILISKASERGLYEPAEIGADQN